MKILLLGKNGQVGWELQRSLEPLGQVIALGRAGADGLVGDLRDLDGIRQTLRLIRPDVVVNAAAYTAVDKAESDPEEARRINTLAPECIAAVVAEQGSWMVHYSTDYVFDGGGAKPWQESAVAAPLNVYGHTKLEGEKAIERSGCKHLIFRTSWVYSSRGNNFAKTMIRLAAERELLKVIDDQVGSPTSAALIADVTAHALRSAISGADVSGLYHLTAAGKVSWYGYAEFVVNILRSCGVELKVKELEAISSSCYLTAAKRPLNSLLNCNKLRDTFNIHLPEWQSGVVRMMVETQGLSNES